VGELYGLRWDEVDFDRGLLTVRLSWKGPTKPSHVRTIPLLAPALEAFETWKEEGGAPHAHVWLSRRGGCYAMGYDGGWADRRERVTRKDKKTNKMHVRPGHKSKAGITRPVRLRYLRHSRASHLVMGFCGGGVAPRGGPRDTPRFDDDRRHRRYAHLSLERIRDTALAPHVVRRPRPRGGQSVRFTPEKWWWENGVSNPGPTPCKGVALPLSYSPDLLQTSEERRDHSSVAHSAQRKGRDVRRPRTKVVTLLS
jgi:integrase